MMKNAVEVIFLISFLRPCAVQNFHFITSVHVKNRAQRRVAGQARVPRRKMLSS